MEDVIKIKHLADGRACLACQECEGDLPLLPVYWRLLPFCCSECKAEMMRKAGDS